MAEDLSIWIRQKMQVSETNMKVTGITWRPRSTSLETYFVICQDIQT